MYKWSFRLPGINIYIYVWKNTTYCLNFFSCCSENWETDQPTTTIQDTNHPQPSPTQPEVKAKAPPPRDPITCARGLSKVPIYHLPTPSLPWWDLNRRRRSFPRPQDNWFFAPNGVRNETQGNCSHGIYVFVQVSYVLHLPLQLWEITMEPWRNCSFGDEFEPFWKSCWFWLHLSFGGRKRKALQFLLILLTLSGRREKMCLWIIQGW